MRFDVKEHVLSHLGAKGRRPSGRTQGKEEIVLVFKHPRQDGLHQRVVRIDQQVPGPKSIEREGKVDHFEGVAAQQGMPEPEAPGRHLRGDVRIEVQRHKAALPPVFFDEAKGAAGWLGVHEVRA